MWYEWQRQAFSISGALAQRVCVSKYFYPVIRFAKSLINEILQEIYTYIIVIRRIRVTILLDGYCEEKRSRNAKFARLWIIARGLNSPETKTWCSGNIAAESWVFRDLFLFPHDSAKFVQLMHSSASDKVGLEQITKKTTIRLNDVCPFSLTLTYSKHQKSSP